MAPRPRTSKALMPPVPMATPLADAMKKFQTDLPGRLQRLEETVEAQGIRIQQLETFRRVSQGV